MMKPKEIELKKILDDFKVTPEMIKRCEETHKALSKMSPKDWTRVIK